VTKLVDDIDKEIEQLMKLKERKLAATGRKAPLTSSHSQGLHSFESLGKKPNNSYTQRMALAKMKSKKTDPGEALITKSSRTSSSSKSAKPTVEGPVEPLTQDQVEKLFKIRINELNLELVQRIFLGKRLVSLKSILKHMQGDDIPGYWLTFGILVEMFPEKTSKKGSKYRMIRLSDLRAYKVNLFAFDDALASIQDCKAGSIFCLLEPKVLRPSQVTLPLSLNPNTDFF
jgi:hypothetical protein